jgi:hypothetical protein
MTHTVPTSLTKRRHGLWFLIGVTTVVVAACGSTHAPSNTQGTPTSNAAATSPTSRPPSAAKGRGEDRVAGLITSVAGSTFVVNQNNSPITVGYSPATKVTETTPVALTDVTVGSCVTVRPQHGTGRSPDGSLTAAAVLIGASQNGQCSAGGQSAGSPTSTPAKPAGHGLRGTVSSVVANTLVVTAAGTTTPTTVDLANTTTYAKRAPADVHAIAQGKCVTARGTTDASGAFGADMIALRPADNGSCRGMKH